MDFAYPCKPGIQTRPSRHCIATGTPPQKVLLDLLRVVVEKVSLDLLRVVVEKVLLDLLQVVVEKVLLDLPWVVVEKVYLELAELALDLGEADFLSHVPACRPGLGSLPPCSPQPSVHSHHPARPSGPSLRMSSLSWSLGCRIQLRRCC